jgi:membrane protein DedA with SNARE-associated domain
VHSIGGIGGLAGICLLLFAEEAGLPLVIAPGEILLLAAGVLVASGASPVWLVLPSVYLSAVAGAVTGYTWASAIGRGRLHALAERLRAGRSFDRAAERLNDARPAVIMASRLLPGLRIYTSLVSGAVAVPRRTFLTALLPGAAVWVLAFVLLGIFVAAPTEQFLTRFAGVALRLAVLAVVVGGTFLLTRRLPGRAGTAPPPHGRSLWRLALALLVDGTAVVVAVTVIAVADSLTRHDAVELVTGAGVFAVVALVYLVVARRLVGITGGEALLGVSYRR